MREAFPNVTGLHELAETVGTTTEEAIRKAGFDVIPIPTTKFPNHHRIIHPEGVQGFIAENLKQLSEVFKNSTGN